jgi:hypothetical protein
LTLNLEKIKSFPNVKLLRTGKAVADCFEAEHCFDWVVIIEFEEDI